MPLWFVRNDIAKMRADAIVNTGIQGSNIGDGVTWALRQTVIPKLWTDSKRLASIAPGETAITPAFNLPAKFVIHTVVPVWIDGQHGERQLLADCYLRSLQLAAEHGCASVAAPLISARTYGCPPEDALEIATQVIRSFIDTHEMVIYLVVGYGQPFRIPDALFKDVQRYINRMYREKLPPNLEEDDVISARPRIKAPRKASPKQKGIYGNQTRDECASEAEADNIRKPIQASRNIIRFSNAVWWSLSNAIESASYLSLKALKN